MKKIQAKAHLSEQINKRNTILAYICVFIFIIIFSISFLILYFDRSKNYTVNYDENSNINYKVFLNENSYYDKNYLNENNEFISKLINYIEANFNYNISTNEDNIDLKYSYKIEANVSVKKKRNDKSIYNFTEILIDTKNLNSISKGIINESINIDYQKYNTLISGFIQTYKLDDVDSILTINMYININEPCKNSSKKETISMSIPLTENTFNISTNDILSNKNDNIIVCEKRYTNTFIYLMFFIISILYLGFMIYKLIIFIKNNQTPYDIYHKELSKILNTYSSYIQEINNININDYKVWNVKTFEDILEISDRSSKPILMFDNKNKVSFIIPDIDNKIYLYELKIKEKA